MLSKIGSSGLWIVGVAMVLSACDDGEKRGDGMSNQGTATAVGGDTEGETQGDTEGETQGDTETDPGGEPEPTTTTSANPDPGVEACDEDAATRACVVPGGAAGGGNDGSQWCDDGVWGPCIEMAACELGEQLGCGCNGGGESTGGEGDCFFDDCVLYDGIPQWACDVDPEWCGCNTPLVLSFGGAEPQYAASATSAFDLDVAGGCTSTDWPTSATPWLALDRDGDGGIADGRELFGSGTRLATGRRAQNGFSALSELDADRNGRITPTDPRFAELVLWSDHDGDKRGTAGELQSLADLRVLSIELAYDVSRVCDERGNCGVERAVFQFAGRGGAIEQGTIVDVHLACQ